MITRDYVVKTNTATIQRKKHFEIITDKFKKKFGFTFDKRVCCEDHCTLPFGHEEIKQF